MQREVRRRSRPAGCSRWDGHAALPAERGWPGLLSARAFSLIECVLALGIASSLLLTAVALLPVGMEATRAAEQSVTEAAIVDSLRAQFAEAEVTGAWKFFDQHGSTLGGGTADAAFVARVLAAPSAPLLDGAGPALRRLRIEISDRPRSAFSDARHTRVFFLLLAPAE